MSEQFITSKDGLKLYIKEWSIDKPKAVIYLVHGFGEHINRYNHVADFFNKNGFTVVGFDIRGHGQSEGKRGHTPQYDSYLDDIETYLTHFQAKYRGLPTFLYGHSMGGNLVLNYLIQRKPSISGVVVTGPWIRLAFEPKQIIIRLGKMMRSLFPTFTQESGLVREHLSKDPLVVEANKNDVLVHTKITASAGMGLTDAAAELNSMNAEIDLPLLIMHGEEDLVTSQPASEEFSIRAKGDVTYKKWAGMYHEIHNEPDKMQVFNYTLGWMDSKI
jgi:alpha-beta hydrolase superfamily lysophospholipase